MILYITALSLAAPMAYSRGADLSQNYASLTNGSFQGPSFLLLSNFANESALITTGVPIPNATLNGLTNAPLSISDIYVAGYGVLPLNVTSNLSDAYEAGLAINNTVIVKGPWGEAEVVLPYSAPYVLLLLDLRSPARIALITSAPKERLSSNEVAALVRPEIFICFNNSAAYMNNYSIALSFASGVGYMLVSLVPCAHISVSDIVYENSIGVDSWLSRSVPPKGLAPQLAREYYLALLALKDDQNPALGTFAASPSPLYLYSWVRDSEFAAMALQLAGHYNSAARYWLWLSRAPRLSWGPWYTRYDFYTGEPDQSFGIPELDSLGLFEIGIYQYYELTHNLTLLQDVYGALASIVSYQVRAVNSSPFHLIPEDLSVWEDRMAYHFWTEALNMEGLLDASYLLAVLGNSSLSAEAAVAAKELNASINEYFWNGSTYCSALVPVAVFTSQGIQRSLRVEGPCVNSAVIYPLAANLSYWPPERVNGTVGLVVEALWNKKVGGLARFPGDDYHYDEYLYDSSGPEPPWIITTLFLALYFEDLDMYKNATELLEWSLQHSQQGLLPEAIDPNYGNPLPTTSPLTWSAAMYVIVSRGASPPSKGPGMGDYAVYGAVLVIIIVVAYFMQRAAVRRVRSWEGPA